RRSRSARASRQSVAAETTMTAVPTPAAKRAPRPVVRTPAARVAAPPVARRAPAALLEPPRPVARPAPAAPRPAAPRELAELAARVASLEGSAAKAATKPHDRMHGALLGAAHRKRSDKAQNLVLRLFSFVREGNSVRAMRAFAAALVVAGCGTAAVRVAPERIARAEAMPAGYSAVGDLVVSCRALDGFQATDGELLASFDCSRKRLERVLAERASDASADTLVGTSCGRDGSVLRCSATAARNDEPSAKAKPLRPSDPGPVPGVARIERWDEPRASAALVIRVDFEPSVEHFARRKREASEVAEQAAL